MTATPEGWQAALARAQGAGRLPSVVGGVLHEGRLAWTGVAGDTPGVEQQYRIGSITKTLTAVLVLQCRDEDLLDLDDPLGRHLPESGYRDVTLRALLSHTSGMQAEPVGPWWERSPGVPVPDLLAANDGTGRVLEPGMAFHYSNLGFALLGEVVARLRGADWWSLVSDRLLGPLGMSRTTYGATAPHAQGSSVDHFAGTRHDEPHADTRAMAPAGQLWSTVEDLARWLAFLASGHPDVLERSTLLEMAAPVAPAREYGLGLRLLRGQQGVLVGHTGSMPGFLATAFVDQATGDGVVALTNATTGVATDRLALDLLVGGDPGADPVESWVPSASVPGEVAELLGLWFWGNSALELRWHNGFLESHTLAPPELSDRYAVTPDQIVGVAGYHLGEILHVHRRADGTVDHLECTTFVYTRHPVR
ncbi:serine hydrolase domain-containing protein [Nocardioides pocheonensis]|uniref:Class A beta-lactamase-related serine hydrolase n=1 Tax=Nocardioides pocheonensis TaxID=661485 RepID=A0A3N0GF97_9ACTN|nr:serine hydrolase domain-containing protein [Nocardioides pocheonensis]RNM11137.1 class A beta-lactamase-related serine hydrolase [Nocardioides pocheonensis]